MPVKHTPTKEVHKGAKGGKTGCGVDTTKPQPTHWENTSEKIKSVRSDSTPPCSLFLFII